MVRYLGPSYYKIIFTLLTKVVTIYVISPIYTSRKQILKRRFQEFFKNLIDPGIKACASNIILKIYYRSSFMYLTMNGVGDISRPKVALKVGIKLVNILGGLESLSKSSSKKIDLDLVELDSLVKIQL